MLPDPIRAHLIFFMVLAFRGRGLRGLFRFSPAVTPATENSSAPCSVMRMRMLSGFTPRLSGRRATAPATLRFARRCGPS